ncbi:MAG: lycopene cyclase domain-containing protein [Flavobacteriales bacterium]|nr:lycopene cyclase domain-containing protein [Flavobacteriales bacterium]MDW8410671.1 lycopene cyclase domain-containing protein [Flavobacteriales bacterium]
MEPRFVYLWINLGSLAIPLILSFDRRVAFASRYRYWLPALLCTALVFILWDIGKTRQGVWGFNPHYITGFRLDVLPWEEVLFFFTIPYACLFIYVCVQSYFPTARLCASRGLWRLASLLSAMAAVLVHSRLYTAITLIYSSALFLVCSFLSNRLGHFPLAYLLHLVPFFIVNGLLTALPVVTYNPEEILGLRLGSIPIEDTLYSLNLFLTNVVLYEWLIARIRSKHRDKNSDPLVASHT